MMDAILALALAVTIQDDTIQGRPLDAWLEELSGYRVDPVVATLAETPEEAYPHFRDLLRGGGNEAVVAADVLCALGEVSRRSLPEIFAIARQEARWTPNHSQRVKVVRALRRLGWAAGEAVAVLEAIALDPDDPVRGWATSAMVPLGRPGREALRRAVNSMPDANERRGAEWSLGTALENERPGARAEYFEALALANPLGPETPRYLQWAAGFDRARPHAACVEVKAALRAALEEEADSDLALQLASILQHELNGMNLQWAIPSKRGTYATPRCDIRESYATLREVLERGLEATEPGSESGRRMATAIAKIGLLRGDWAMMDRALARMGESAPPEEDRPFLAAPPRDWSQLAGNWKPAHASMRSGRGRLVVRVELPDRGVPGAQVLVWKAVNARQPVRVHSSGWVVDTLMEEPLPLDGFGYKASDRDQTRYAFTGDDGVAVLERLPAGDLRLEVMVPTAALPGDAERYSMWLEHPSEGWKSTGLGSLGHGEPPELAVAVDDRTTEYPRLLLRPHYPWNIQQWNRVDPGSLELRWREIEGAQRYRLEMRLSTPPDGSPQMPEHAGVFRRWSQDVDDTSHDLSRLGVDGHLPAAGNLYVFSVLALGEDDAILAEFGPTRVWTPWAHRDGLPPLVSHAGFLSNPDFWPERRGLFDGRNLRRDHPETLRAALETRADEYEAEYARVVLAWLDWQHGRVRLASQSLEQLREQLDGGNAVRIVAELLLEGIAAGVPPPRRLDFDEELLSLKEPPPGLRIEDGRHHLDHHGLSFLPPAGWHAYPSTREGQVATLSRGGSQITIWVTAQEPGFELESWLRDAFASAEGVSEPELHRLGGREVHVVDASDRDRNAFLLEGRRLFHFDLRVEDPGDLADLDFVLSSLEFLER